MNIIHTTVNEGSDGRMVVAADHVEEGDAYEIYFKGLKL